MTDWVVVAELHFPAKQVAGKEKDDAREYAKQCLAKLMEMRLLNHYHILSLPRKVEI